MSNSSHASLNLHDRWPKAEKIRLLLNINIPVARPLRVLEVGTGSGGISHYFSQLDPSHIAVTAIDVADQRQVLDGYSFLIYDGRTLPFEDGSFDLIISNHVIEHIGGRDLQSAHIGELARMLGQQGRLYLATPSRWQVVEPHFRLPFLSWIPTRWRDGYVRWLGKGDRYDCDPLSHAEIEDLFDLNRLRHVNTNIAAFRATRQLEPAAHSLFTMIDLIPDRILQWFYRFSPTMIYILESELASEAGSPVASQPAFSAYQ